MKVKQKTVNQIIDETVAWYGADPEGRRAIEGSHCMYYDPETGNKCAVGRCVRDSVVKKKNFPQESVTRDHHTKIFIMEHLKAEYKGHDPVFWRQLQKLHDGCGYWDFEKGGLTKPGMVLVKAIRNQYAMEEDE